MLTVGSRHCPSQRQMVSSLSEGDVSLSGAGDASAIPQD